MERKNLSTMVVVVLAIVTTAFAAPQIYYTYPTPDDGATIIDPDVEIGAIITEPALSDMKFTFQGTDYSFYDSTLVLMFNFDNIDDLGENYQFDPGLGVRDISLYGNDGILSNPPGIPTWSESAKYSGAFDFSGNGVDSGQSILILHDDSLNPGSGDFALCTWIYTKDDYDGDILRKGSTSTATTWYKIEHSPGSATNQLSLNFQTDATSVTVTSPQAYNDYQWHHVVAQRRADTAELWVDGDLVGSVAVTGSISNIANLAIGSKDTQDDDFLNSMLDEVRIYMRSFAPDEIEQLYNSNLSRRNSPDEWMFRTKQVGLANDTYSHGISVTNQTPETTIISQTFTIQQPVPPTVTLDSPADNAILNNPDVTFTASATDLFGLTQAELYVGGQQQTLIFSGPVDILDAQITADSPTINDGSGLSINVDGVTPHAHAVMKFPTLFGSGQVPPGSTIVSATVEINCTNPGNTMRIYRLIQDFIEDEVTWDNAADFIPWINPGADGAGSNAQVAYNADCSVAGLRTIDITELTQQWSDGDANYGILLTDSGTDGVDFDSSETAYSPILTVIYMSEWELKQTQTLTGTTDTAVFTPITLEDQTNYIWNVLVTNSHSLQSWAVNNFALRIDGQSPDTPVLVEPANGAADVAIPTTLTVSVSDPQGEDLTVSFYGRKAVSTADDFTIVVLPDTQKYCLIPANTQYFADQTQWIVDNADMRNIVFVTHSGDIVDTATSTTEYDAASLCLSTIDPALVDLDNASAYQPVVPYGLLMGNHDGSTLFNEHFPYSRYKDNLSWYGDSSDGVTNENSYQLFSSAGLDFIILHLSYNPSVSVIGWAHDILNTYSDRIAIINTHGYLETSGSMDPAGDLIRSDLVIPHENVWFVLCGHNHDEYTRIENLNGHNVYQLLADYQDRPNGGNGWLRTMRFSPADNKVYVQTYSPSLGQYETDGNSEFALDMPLNAFTFIGTQSVPSDSDASVIWTDPTPGGLNEWFVEVADGTNTTVGSLWTFTAEGNDPPIAVNDEANTDEDYSVIIDVLANDYDPDFDTFFVHLFSQPTNGSLTDHGDGTFTYDPDADYHGSDSFTYSISDGFAVSNTATVTITVDPINDPPVAVDDTATTAEDTLVTITVLANDSDVENDTLTVISATDPLNGTVVINPENTITYTPDPAYNGTDVFAYTISDGLDTDTATVTVTVSPVNDIPIAVDDAYNINEDGQLNEATIGPLGLGVLANDTDSDSPSLTAQLENGTLHGTLTFNTNGSFIYTPNADYSGTDSFTYFAYDGTNSSNIAATVTITITQINDPPVANDDSASTDAGIPVDIDVLANDTDAEDDPLSVVPLSLTNPTNGSAVDNGDGTITYTSNPGFDGQVSFTYQVTDGALTDTATVTIDVTAVDYDAYALVQPVVTIGGIPVGAVDATTAADGVYQTIDEAPDGPAAYSLRVEYVLYTQVNPTDVSEPVTINLVRTWTGGTTDALLIELLVAGTWTDVTTDIGDGQCQAAATNIIDAEGNIRIRFADTLNKKKEAKDTLAIDLLYADIVAGSPTPDTQPPTPNPMTWATLPYATGTSSISMTATTATDASGVEYSFTCTTGGGHDSGWQDSPTYEDTGLSPGTTYTYKVEARDKSPAQNVTGPSSDKSATTDAPDTTPPTPNSMTWATLPYATGTSSISMTATTATDASGVEYYFTNVTVTDMSHDSGWQDSPTYEDTGLSPGTTYAYKVEARDKSPAQNVTGASSVEPATTDAPDTTPPTPNSMTWATVPYATGSTSIAMVATTATDPSGVEYYFAETSGNPGGSDSGWQDSPTYEDTGLNAGTQYTYTVKARDKSPNQNETAASTAESATTGSTATVYVASMVEQSFLPAGQNVKAVVGVTINILEAGATVSGDWYFNDELIASGTSGITDAAGYTEIVSVPEKAKSGDVFRFEITDVSLSGYTYDSSGGETEISITVPSS